MPLSIKATIFLLPPLAYAIVGNTTIAFYEGTSSDTCSIGPPPGAISLTTSTLPLYYTCFNVSDIFSQGNTSGYQNNSYADFFYSGGPTEPTGVNWTLTNLANYNPQANYSGVWFQQMNLTSDQAEEGKPAGRWLAVYAFPNCEQQSKANGGDDPIEDAPWFTHDCQTGPDGECHTVPNSVQSFAIRSTEVVSDKCENWAYLGGATTMQSQSLVVMIGLAVIVSYISL